MELIVKNSVEEISQEVASKIINVVQHKPNAVLGLATGSSPLLAYQDVVAMSKSLDVSFRNIQTFNLDEYIGNVDEKMTYRYFMNENLFKRLDININSTHFPSPESPEKYDELIRQSGGIDLQILGVGQNGHIAFNEPYTDFQSSTHIVTLDSKTRADNARFFPSLDAVPTQAISMGLQTIIKSKKIIVLVIGDNKVSALKKLLCHETDLSFPASILNNHPNVVVYTTYDLYKKAIS